MNRQVDGPIGIFVDMSLVVYVVVAADPAVQFGHVTKDHLHPGHSRLQSIN